MRKRVLALLLAVAMVAGMVTVVTPAASAAEDDYSQLRLMNGYDWTIAAIEKAGLSTDEATPSNTIITSIRVFSSAGQYTNGGASDFSDALGTGYAYTHALIDGTSEKIPADQIDRIVIRVTYNGQSFDAVFKRSEFDISWNTGLIDNVELTLNNNVETPETGEHTVTFLLEYGANWYIYDVVYVPNGETLGDQMPAQPDYGDEHFVNWETESGVSLYPTTPITQDWTVRAIRVTSGGANEYHIMQNGASERYQALQDRVADNYNDINSGNANAGDIDISKIAVNGVLDGESVSTNIDYFNNGWRDYEGIRYYYIYNIGSVAGDETQINTDIPPETITGITVEFSVNNTGSYTVTIPKDELEIKRDSDSIIEIYIRDKLDGIEKELVTSESDVPAGLTASDYSYPDNSGVVTIPEGENVTLLYKITVTGDQNAQYIVTDEGATWVSGDSMSGTLGADGEAVIYVTKAFTAPVNGELTNSATLTNNGNTIPPDESDSEDDVSVDAEEGEEPGGEEPGDDPANNEIYVNVYLDGEQLSSAEAAKYVDLTTAENADAAGGMSYQKEDGEGWAENDDRYVVAYVDTDDNPAPNSAYADITVALKSGVTGVLVQSIVGDVVYGSSDDEAGMTINGGSYTMGNVKLHSNLDIYLNTVYSVDYKVPEGYTVQSDDTTYIINEHEADTDNETPPESGTQDSKEYCWVTKTSYSTQITLPALTEQNNLAGLDGWYHGNNNTADELTGIVNVSDYVPTTGTTITFYAQKSAPTFGELTNPNGLNLRVTINCASSVGHGDDKVGLIANTEGNVTYEVKRVEGNANQFTVTIKDPDDYIAEYNKGTFDPDYGPHWYHGFDGSHAFVVEWSASGWSVVDDFDTVTILAKCLPSAPTGEELTNLLDDRITVDCIDGVGHSDAVYGLIEDDYSTAGSQVKYEKGRLIYEVTIITEAYVERYNGDTYTGNRAHKALEDTETAVLVFNTSTKEWEISGGVTIQVTDPEEHTITVEVVNGTASATGLSEGTLDEDTSTTTYTLVVDNGENATLNFTANTGYALDTLQLDNGTATMLTSGTYTLPNVTENHTVRVVCSTDNWTDGSQTTPAGEDSTDKGDGIPDNRQVVVNYVAGNGGTVNGVESFSEVLTIAADGTVTITGSTAAANSNYRFVNWTNTAGVDSVSNATLGSVTFVAAGNTTYTFTANFARNSVPVNPPVTDPDPDEPGDLNTEEHFSYLIGYEDGTVRPEADITRAEVATIFFRLLTDEAREEHWSTTNPFSDVDRDDWFNTAVSTMSKMGIVDGYEDGTFRPNEPITRAEFVTIATRFFDYAAQYEEGTFTDVEGDEWYADYIQAGVDLGLIDGYEDGSYRPGENITRAEAATIVNRVLGRKPHEDHLLDEDVMNVWSDNDADEWYYAQIQEATNTHEYAWTTEDGEQVERWTAKMPDPDWDELEQG